jgi:hypothetical protein
VRRTTVANPPATAAVDSACPAPEHERPVAPA